MNRVTDPAREHPDLLDADAPSSDDPGYAEWLERVASPLATAVPDPSGHH